MNDDLIYRQYLEPIKRYLGRYVDEAHVEELAQEVFIKVARSREDFRGEASIKTWIYRIATNQAKDFLKSRYKKDSDAITESELEQYDTDSPEQLSMTAEMNDCINEFIHRLPSDYSSILLLSELEGNNIREISEILGISQNTTKVRLHRARAKLRDEMQHGCTVTMSCDNRMMCERKE